jgi:hypothetical protein
MSGLAREVQVMIETGKVLRIFTKCNWHGPTPPGTRASVEMEMAA